MWMSKNAHFYFQPSGHHGVSTNGTQVMLKELKQWFAIFHLCFHYWLAIAVTCIAIRDAILNKMFPGCYRTLIYHYNDATVHWSIITMMLLYTDVSLQWCYCILIYHYNDATVHWSIITMMLSTVHWSIITMMLPYTDLSLQWCYCTLIYHYNDDIVHWCIITMMLPCTYLSLQWCYCTLIYH